MRMRSSFEISNQANNLMFHPVSRRMGKSAIVKITCCDRGSTSPGQENNCRVPCPFFMKGISQDCGHVMWLHFVGTPGADQEHP
jgi:hypothetical protein